MSNHIVMLKTLGVFLLVSLISTIACGGIFWLLHPVCGLSCVDFIISAIYASPIFGMAVGIFVAFKVNFHDSPTKAKHKRKTSPVDSSNGSKQIAYVFIGFFCVVLLAYVGAIVRNHHLVNQADAIRADIDINPILSADTTTQSDVESLLNQTPYRGLNCATEQSADIEEQTLINCRTPTMLRRIPYFLPVEAHGSDYGYYTVVFTFDDNRLQDVTMRGWLCGMGTDTC
ncbi:MAG: hypothetical protein AAFR81_27015 [Chloroflexota bacterium]